MVATLAPPAGRLKVDDIDLEVVRRGNGQKASVLAPSHPGFGDSPRPADFETVYDLVHLYRELGDDKESSSAHPSAVGRPRKLRLPVPLGSTAAG